ncbi:head-tail adaptor protein [Acidovorax sp. NCPPB 4044]|nr:head-tail adaptor protein [Acidovorax sp. NCPPB 4044]
MKTTWAEHLSCWAQRRDHGGAERAATAAGGVVAVARVEFVVRLRDGITEKMRVLHKARYHNIQHVKPLADYPGWMVLTTDTGVNDG